MNKKELLLVPESMVSIDKRLQIEEKVENLRDTLDRINNQILDLFRCRISLLHEIRAKISNIIGTKHFFDTEYSKIESEWNKYNFESETIRAIVHVVRNLFFDDSKDECKKWNCRKLLFEYEYSVQTSIGFNFVNGENQFDIYIPVSIERSYYDGFMVNDIFLENIGCGEITVALYFNNYVHRFTKSSLNMAEIKDFVIYLCKNYDDAIKSEINKQFCSIEVSNEDSINLKPLKHKPLITMLREDDFTNKQPF